MQGVFKMPFWLRLVLLWFAVACMPLLGLMAVALNPVRDDPPGDFKVLQGIALIVGLMGIAASALISWIVGRDLLRWLGRYSKATKRIRSEDYAVRIDEKRPDEWGRLNDDFNDMAAGLETGRHVYETFGQFVGLDARGPILEMLSRLGGEVRDVTVVFIDIRGFTRRSSGARPERVVELLNEFLSLAVAAIEDNRGMVNKFLGDGLMALFGGPPDWHGTHADLAVQGALNLTHQLERFNHCLMDRGETPLRIGVGIHTGPALVGCVGATIQLTGGRVRTRKEFTVIGETVNLCQRIEQLTKTCGGPILISEQTRCRLQLLPGLVDCGLQELERSNDRLHIFQVNGVSM
jgi:adenylate cyclase